MYADPRIGNTHLSCWLPVDLVGRLKRYCAEHGYPIDAVIDEALQEHLNKHLSRA